MPKSKKQVVADSWDDEDVSDDVPEEPTPQPRTPASSASAPSATSANPTNTTTSAPLDASHFTAGMRDWDDSSSTRPDTTPNDPSDDTSREKRPEKTDAVARRMIAAGLGLRAPKQTEEQKAYQKAVREQEKKRREQERAEEQRRREMTDKAKAAIWDD